ncbi:FadR/GntR family transcriptional regulator [Streptomyces coryli]|uniref:FadR/GntR family transcriptional regulator n=1 Tax=Streptomyces coryli TaxID=1128680 RepID=UPI003B832A1C
MRRHRTMHEWAVDELVRRIVSGEAAPGDSLPVEEKLAAELGVSRGVLREAVKTVAGKGMLGIRPRTGTKVLPPAGWNYLDADVLRWQQEYETRRLLRETVELRRTVEPAAARLAAARRLPDDVKALLEAYERMVAAARRPDHEGYVEADAAFHRALLDATGNRLFGSLGRALDVALQHSFAISTETPGALEASLPRHLAVAEAIGRGDGAEAADAVLAIIESAEYEIAHSPALDPDPPAPPVRNRNPTH